MTSSLFPGSPSTDSWNAKNPIPGFIQEISGTTPSIDKSKCEPLHCQHLTHFRCKNCLTFPQDDIF